MKRIKKRIQKRIQKHAATIKTPLAELGKEDTIAHYNAVLIEDLKSGMKQVIESVETRMDGFGQELREFRSETNGRFEIVEGVLRQHSKILSEHGAKLDNLQKTADEHGIRLDNIEKDVTELKTDVAELKTDVKELKTDMTEVKGRLSTISTKIDGQNVRLDDHETRITTLETTHL